MSRRTIENCTMHKRALKEEIGHCWTDKGKCTGYAGTDGDEPHPTCQECKLNVLYKENHDTEMQDEYMRSGY